MSEVVLVPGDVCVQHENGGIWWMEKYRPDDTPRRRVGLVGRCIRVPTRHVISHYTLWDGNSVTTVHANDSSPFDVHPTKGVERIGHCEHWEAALAIAQLAGEEGFCEQG